jgi:uncharacterized protein YhhL (DUF1145 family)
MLMNRKLILTAIIFSALLVSTLVGVQCIKVAKANPIISPDIWVSSPQNKVYNSTEVQLSFWPNTPFVNFTSFSYSLDGRANVAINDNTTLTGLSFGSHSIVVYGTDTAGKTYSSWTIHFDVFYSTARVVFDIVIVAVVCVGLLICFKKRKTLAMAFRAKKTASFWYGLIALGFGSLFFFPSAWTFISVNYLYPPNQPSEIFIDPFVIGVGILFMVTGLLLMKSGIKKRQNIPQATAA